MSRYAILAATAAIGIYFGTLLTQADAQERLPTRAQVTAAIQHGSATVTPVQRRRYSYYSPSYGYYRYGYGYTPYYGYYRPNYSYYPYYYGTPSYYYYSPYSSGSYYTARPYTYYGPSSYWWW